MCACKKTPKDWFLKFIYIFSLSGLQNKTEITKGIQHIISDVIAKDRRVLDFVQPM